LAVCPDTNEILFSLITDNSTPDSHVYGHFLNNASTSVERSYGDGAYDVESCYLASFLHGSELITPPRRNAVYQRTTPSHMDVRNNSYLEILGLGGDEDARKLWKKLKRYHRRSLAETAMFRVKQMFGDDLSSKRFCRQKAEIRVKSKALNIMTRLGMPKGEWMPI